MTQTISTQPLPSTHPCLDFVRKNPTATAITGVALIALGIVAVVGSTIAATTTLAAILGIAAALSFLGSSTLLILDLYQMAVSIKEEGYPPNIPLDDVGAQKNYRVQVMNDTMTHLRAGFYTSPDGTRHPLDLRPAASGAGLLLNGGIVGQRPGNETTSIVVKNQDCLYAAKDLHAKGLNPIVLDMASDGHFGGGYLGGARAQEEECCRRSGLPLAADTQHGLQNRNFYPLSQQSPSAALYVPNVPVFRSGYDKGYQYLNQPFNVAFGVVAAFHNPPLNNSSGRPRLQPHEAEITRQKVRTFFEMARQKGHKSVVFGALGCGAFHNPPDHIAEIVMQVIQQEFKHCFKEIVIAVVDDHNAGHAHNPQGNFAPFARRVLASGGKAIDASGNEITSL
jgi:uncharacterized protein (TIGR02452 family)